MFGNPGKIELFVKVTHLKFDLIIYPMASFDQLLGFHAHRLDGGEHDTFSEYLGANE